MNPINEDKGQKTGETIQFPSKAVDTRDRLELLFNTMKQGVVNQARDGNIIFSNRAAEIILGVTSKEMMERTSDNPEWASTKEDGTPFPGSEHPSMRALETGKEVLDVVMGIYNPTKDQRVWIKIDAIPLFRAGEDAPYEAYTVFEDITEKIKRERDLRDSGDRYRSLFESAGDAIMITRITPHGPKFEACNKKAEELFGVEEGGFCGLDPVAISPSVQPDGEDSASNIMKNIQRVLIGETIQIEWYHRKLDGTDFPCEVTLSAIQSHGEPLIQAIVRDITERKSAEDRIKRSEEKFRLLFETTPEGISMTDLSGNMTSVNPANLRMLGYNDEKELLGKSTLELIINEQREEALKVFADVLVMEKVGPERYNLIKKDGSIIPAELTAAVVRSTSGEPESVIAVTRDISGQLKAEKRLYDSESRYRLLFETAKETILVAQDGMIKFVNPSGPKLLGFSIEELSKRPFMDFIHPDDKPMVAERHQKRLRGDSDMPKYPFRLMDKNGNIKWVEVEAVQIPWEGRPATLNFLSDVTDRLETENALRESEEKYRELVENAKVIVLKWDLNGNILFANEYAEKFFGYEPDELIGKNAVGTIVPEIASSGADLRNLINDIAADPEKFSVNENENLKKDGQRVWIQWTNKVILDDHGKATSMLSIGNDITEKRRNEAVIREWDYIVRAFIDQPLLGILIIDEEGRLTEWNSAMEDFFGRVKEDVLGTYIWDIQLSTMPPEMRTEERRNQQKNSILQSLKTGVPVYEGPREYRSYIPGKGVCYFQHSLFPIRSEKGFRFCSLTIDITDRMISEEARIVSEEKYRTLLDNLSDAVIELGTDTKLIYVSPHVKDIYGYEPDDMIGRSLLDFVREEDRGTITDLFNRSVADREVMNFEFGSSHKERGHLHLSFSARVVEKKDGNLSVVGILQDVTEKIHSRRQIEVEKNRAEFYLDLLSHDIGNIHQGLQVWTEMARSPSTSEENRDRALGKIEELEKRSLRLVRNVLLLSRLKDRKPIMEVVDIIPFAEKSIQDIKTMFDERSMEITFTKHDDSVLVMGETVIEEIFFNLLHNAVKFQYDEIVRIDLSCETSGDTVTIDIADHGIGISEDQKDQLFDRHIKGSDFGYSGIGLSLVKELVTRYGGSIEVLDRIEGDPGKGALFRIKLIRSDS